MKDIKIVIGKNYGDEGKGQTTAYFAGMCPSPKSCLTIKHNGGAQAGHTVIYQDKRFIFHQLSSASIYGSQ